MASTFWTGPRGRPGRYVVESASSVPKPEPGGGVEGRVYRARVDDPGAPDHGDTVALKLLIDRRPQQLSDIERRLAALTDVVDPRLMRVREVFVGTALTDERWTEGSAPDPDDFDVCFVVADWVDGEPLGDAAQRQDIRWILDVTAQLADAVAALHTIRHPAAPDGVVHRDLKTSNVRVDRSGQPVLVDYGLARPVDTDASVVGTPGWLAPEVASGHPGGVAADVYGVGAIAHDLLLGAPPRRDGSAAAISTLSIALRELPLGDEIARHLSKLLELDAAERPYDLADWATGLRRLLDGQSLTRPNRTLPVALAALVSMCVLAAVMVFSLSSGDSDEQNDVEAMGRTATAGDELVADAGAQPPDTDASTTVTPTTAPLPCNREPALPVSDVGTAVRTAFLDDPDACAGPVEPFGDGTALRLIDSSGSTGDVIIASPVSPAVRLSSAQYSSYTEVIGRGQTAYTTNVAGFPASVTTDDETGLELIELTGGGVMIGPATDSQVFWVPIQIRGLWERTGGLHGSLGVPTSPVFVLGGTLRLEFQHGYMTAAVANAFQGQASWLLVEESDIEIVPVDAEAELAALGDVRGRILRQANGTAWYVTDDGVRHWIADGPTWGCLDGDSIVRPGDVPGYVIGALPAGPKARC